MVDPDLAQRIQAETARLLPPSNVDEAESVARSGEFVIDLLASAARRRDLTLKDLDILPLLPRLRSLTALPTSSNCPNSTTCHWPFGLSSWPAPGWPT
jgi:hypothetical protein